MLQALIYLSAGAALVLLGYSTGFSHGLRAHGSAWERSGTRERSRPFLRCLLWVRRPPLPLEWCARCCRTHRADERCQPPSPGHMGERRHLVDGHLPRAPLQTPARPAMLRVVPLAEGPEICPTCRQPCVHVGDHACPVDG